MGATIHFDLRTSAAATGNETDIPVVSGPPSGGFHGHFIVTSDAVIGSSLQFPMKKRRNKLTHYSIGKVTHELVSLLPPSDFLRHKGRQGSCAVVGNGGTLLLYELGHEIDSHDVVLRLNSGPVSGFVKHVGKKTDIRMVNRAHLGYREAPSEKILQHVSTSDSLKNFISLRKKTPKDPFFIISMDFHEHAYRYTDKGVLSNGMYAILLASELCEFVTIYGFLRQWRHNTKYHYYNDEEPDATQSIRDTREELRMKKFMQERNATHRYGEPCMTEACSNLPCKNCPYGTTCACGVWHPVPLPSYCYKKFHPLGRGVPDIGCIIHCGSMILCPGGLQGICPTMMDVGSVR